MIQACKKVIITGPTAVGKSSIIKGVCENLMKNKFKFSYIPEYIDGRKDGLTMLNKYFTHEISVFKFQNYILNYYRDTLKNLRGNNMLIFERCIDDGITCYSNLDHKINTLSTVDFLRLYDSVKNLDKKYNLPSYILGNNFVFTPIKAIDVKKTSKLITDIIRSTGNKNNIFGLYHTDETLWQRMCKRNRPGEKESYTRETLKEFNAHYRKLYKGLMYGDGFKFTELGKLI